jgi:hypothetical protein
MDLPAPARAKELVRENGTYVPEAEFLLARSLGRSFV